MPGVSDPMKVEIRGIGWESQQEGDCDLRWVGKNMEAVEEDGRKTVSAGRLELRRCEIEREMGVAGQKEKRSWRQKLEGEGERMEGNTGNGRREEDRLGRETPGERRARRVMLLRKYVK